MPFIGKNPNAGFATIVKDTLTADGSTTQFTLSKQVASTTDIAVFVGNVRQEPTTAYTVNGTTLDFGSGNAPATGLDMYVLHIGGTQEVSTVPADGTISSAKIINSAVTSAKLDTNIAVSGNLDVGTIRSTGGTTAMTIGSNGLIQPKQVAFQVEALDTDQAISASGSTKLEFPTVALDTGGYWDTTNHRFTPQVAGWYMFGGVARLLISSINQVVGLQLRKNGSSATSNTIANQLQFSSDVITNGGYDIPTGIVQLNGSTDYMEVTANGDEAMTFSDASNVRSVFWGILVHAT
jgi:hypothetical protein